MTRCFRQTIVVAATSLMVATWTPIPQAAAQLTNARQAIIDRQLRAARGRALSDPQGAARDLGQVRGELHDYNRGVTLGPNAARIDRQLRTLGDQQVHRPAAPPVSAPNQPAQPPSSVQPGSSGIPSVDQNVALARGLLDHASEGIAEGREDSARSDLSIVQETLSGLKGLKVAAPLTARASALQARLDRRDH